MPAVPVRPAGSRGRAAAAILAAVLLAGACSGDGGPSVAPTTKPPTTTSAPDDAGARPTTTDATGGGPASTTNPSGTEVTPVAWTGCGGSFECGDLSVPLDHDQPGGDRLALALIRRPARKPAQRIGSLVVNFGGPGASGVSVMRDFYGTLPAAVRDRFDVVSFDPRGVADSDGIDCGTDAAALIALDGDPDTQAERDAVEAAQEDQAARCEQAIGGLLTHVGTVDAARDLDRIRAAVGDEGLTYLGFSYGSELGFAYATLFPDHIRALVLDGAIDPALPYADILRSQADGLERAIDGFFAECASRSRCGLGADPEAATRELLAELEAGATLPAKVGDEQRTLRIGDAQYGILAGLYDEDFGWPQLELALVQARDGDGGPLLALADTVTGYEGDGRYDSLFDAYAAITCADRAERPAFAQATTFAAELARRDPFWGAWVGYGLSGCADWPLADEVYDHDGTAPGAPPILVVGAETGDPVTPYDQTSSLAARLDSGVLLTWEGGGHTSYGTDDCIDDAVNVYLVDGEPPADGTTC